MYEKGTMLVVDDVEVNRASFKAMFENEYEVLETDNGQSALEILRKKKVDIIMLDVFLPVMDGKEVLRNMKMDSTLRDIPVLVKTSVDEGMEVEMLEYGADDFIFSPCEPAVVKNRVKNITQKYMRRQTMRQKLEEERRLRKMREQFMMHVLREIQSDVQSIELCCKEDAEEGAGRTPCEKQVGQYTGHILKMVRSILDDSKMLCEQPLLHRIPFQLQCVAVEICEEYSRVCRKGDIHFYMENVRQDYDNLVGDCRWLKQIWSQLLKRACENTQPGGSVYTACVPKKRQRGCIDLELKVCGGIDAGEKYSIISSIVELLNGTMEIEHIPGRESVCVVTLPFGEGKEPVSQKKRFDRMRVLILDDNEITRSYHVTMLTRLGISCDAAPNGAEAEQMLEVAYAQGAGYDICFVNWYMPGGEAFIREMRQKYPPERMLIACSTSEKEWIGDSMQNTGVDYVIEKPVYQSALFEFLKKTCGKKREKASLLYE